MPSQKRQTRKMMIGRAVLNGQPIEQICSRYNITAETASQYATHAAHQIAHDRGELPKKRATPTKRGMDGVGLDNGRVKNNIRRALKTMPPEEVARRFVAPIEIVLGLADTSA